MAHDINNNHIHFDSGSNDSIIQIEDDENEDYIEQEIIAQAENNPKKFWGNSVLRLRTAIIAIQGSDNIDFDEALRYQIGASYYGEAEGSFRSFFDSNDRGLITHLLVRKGANVNQITEYSEIGSEEIKSKSLFDIIYKVEDLYFLFLDHGLDIKAIDNTDRPFLFAQMPYIVSMYEAHPAFPYHKDISDVSLRIATAIEKGANVNAKGNDFHSTALMQLSGYAMDDFYDFGYEGIIDITKLLLASGADINITNDDGYTAWDIFRCYLDRYESQADSKYYEPHQKAVTLFERLVKPAQTRPLAELKCRENVHKFNRIKNLENPNYIPDNINVRY